MKKLYILPLGHLENHGAHLPNDVDKVILEHIANRLKAIFGEKVVIDKTIERGIGGIPPRDALSMPEYYNVIKNRLMQILRKTDKLLIINSHNPNIFVVHQAIEDIDIFYKKIVLIDIWKLVMPELKKEISRRKNRTRRMH